MINGSTDSNTTPSSALPTTADATTTTNAITGSSSSTAAASTECTTTSPASAGSLESDLHREPSPNVDRDASSSSPSPPSSTASPSPSAAADTAEDTSAGELDEFFHTALRNPRDRLTLLKLDQELAKFIETPTYVSDSLTLPRAAHTSTLRHA